VEKFYVGYYTRDSYTLQVLPRQLRQAIHPGAQIALRDQVLLCAFSIQRHAAVCYATIALNMLKNQELLHMVHIDRHPMLAQILVRLLLKQQQRALQQTDSLVPQSDMRNYNIYLDVYLS
jgi:hypothetical protein